MGNGTTNEIAEPLQVSGLNNIIAISAGYGFNLALKDDGTVYAWGYNYYGQLGDGTNNNSLIPIKVNGLFDVKDIFASKYNSIVLKSDGTVWAWGSNSYGLLGYGTINEISYVPVQVKDLSDVNAIASKYGHNLALKNDGTVWAWGYNSNGQLGNDTLINSYVPVKVKALTDVTYIEAGAYHSLAQKSDGTVWAWALTNTDN
ncbi:BNR repeat protein [Acetivibrio straminisolvens JCM 21531]|uniref:BNR repeat protein n=1 Tax=Acetivibrio straminisolvens JCM 21531 TaxID=1294263 RepID=W4VC44_9FIRM|nr:BNR repeat protein [Acetivibrio straminisolvens JCM 21531]